MFTHSLAHTSCTDVAPSFVVRPRANLSDAQQAVVDIAARFRRSQRPGNEMPWRARRTEAAFTLIEIVLVITIIAVLGAALIYGIKGNVDVAKETRVESDIKSIVTQLKVYEARNLQPPTTEQGLKALVEMPTIEPVPERWTQLLEEMPKDPWKHEFRYQYPAKRSKADYDVYSLGKDGVESADDIGNWKLGGKN
jgi:general secretion pathway protein G